jgi:hypothetical protein
MRQRDQFLSCGRLELRLTQCFLSHRIRLSEELVYEGQKFDPTESWDGVSAGRIRGVPQPVATAEGPAPP